MSANITKLVSKFLLKRGNGYSPEAYIISYPKCGRTWVRLLIGKALCEQFNLPDELLLDTYKLTTVAPLLRTRITHEDSHLYKRLEYSLLSADKQKYAGKKVVFLTRNVKDVLVSSYFHATKKMDVLTDNLSDFIRSDQFGAKKVITFYNIWYENRAVPKDFLHLRYEELHASSQDALAELLSFLELGLINKRCVQRAVSYCEFSNMRKLEKKDHFGSEILRPGNASDEESYKTRRGVVGGYTSYLSAEDIEYVERIIKEMGCPFCI